MKSIHFVTDPKSETMHFNDDGKLVPNIGIKCFLPDGTMIRGANKQRKYMRENYPDMPSLKPVIREKKTKNLNQIENLNNNTKKIAEPIRLEKPEMIYDSVESIKDWQLTIIKSMFVVASKKKIKLAGKRLFCATYYHSEFLKNSAYKNITDCVLHEQSKTVIRASSYLETIYNGTFLHNVNLPDFINNDILADCFFEKAKTELLSCKMNEKKIVLFVMKCVSNYNRIINSGDDPLLPLKNKWPANFASFFLDYQASFTIPWFLLFCYRPQYNKNNVDIQKSHKNSNDGMNQKRYIKAGTLLKYAKKYDRSY